MRRNYAWLHFALAVPASLAVSCSVSQWNDFESQATVATVASSKPFPSQSFGTLLASYRTTAVSGHLTSRLVVGSGRIDLTAGAIDGMFAVYTGWDDTRLRLGAKLYSHCDGTKIGCPDDAGTSLAPIPDIAGRQGCVIAGAPNVPALGAAPSVVVSCETSADGTLRPLVEKWYPGLANNNSAAAAQVEAA